MNRQRLVQALNSNVPSNLAEDVVSAYLEIRQDAATRTLGRVSAGKFIETVVQILQYRALGSFDERPDVEDFLARRVEHQTSLDDGLRICAARIARSAYALRSKRGIAHKATVDANGCDLQLLHAMARWTVAELLRQSQGVSMEEAGTLIDMVHAPVNRVVEDIDGHRLIHGDFGTKEEVLVLLHSHYPEFVETDEILASLQRRKTRSVEARIRELFAMKLIHGSRAEGYRLTAAGFDAAVAAISRELARNAA